MSATLGIVEKEKGQSETRSETFHRLGFDRTFLRKADMQPQFEQSAKSAAERGSEAFPWQNKTLIKTQSTVCWTHQTPPSEPDHIRLISAVQWAGTVNCKLLFQSIIKTVLIQASAGSNEFNSIRPLFTWESHCAARYNKTQLSVKVPTGRKLEVIFHLNGCPCRHRSQTSREQQSRTKENCWVTVWIKKTAGAMKKNFAPFYICLAVLNARSLVHTHTKQDNDHFCYLLVSQLNRILHYIWKDAVNEYEWKAEVFYKTMWSLGISPC